MSNTINLDPKRLLPGWNPDEDFKYSIAFNLGIPTSGRKLHPKNMSNRHYHFISWLEERNIEYQYKYTVSKLYVFFKNEPDAVLFDLTWR